MDGAGSIKARNRQEELTMVVEKHRGRLLSFISSRVRDRVEAEDVAQEVFEEFFASYDLGLAIESLGAWLARVAQNKIIDRFRRNKTRSDYQSSKIEAQDQTDLLSANQPDDEWSRTQLRSEIVEALTMLSVEQRDVFIKHELEGKTFEEISAETGVNINTLLSRKKYAVTFLREHLKEIYDELE